MYVHIKRKALEGSIPSLHLLNELGFDRKKRSSLCAAANAAAALVLPQGSPTSPCRLPDVVRPYSPTAAQFAERVTIFNTVSSWRSVGNLDPGGCYFHLDLLTDGRRESGCQSQPSGEVEGGLRMKRQFVNLVLDTLKSGSFTMHRIKSSSLFHPKNQNGHPLPPTSLVEAELPQPACTLDLSIRKDNGGKFMFMPFGSSRDKIVSADQDGIVLVHDICQNRLSSKPRLRGWNANSMAITLGDDLYLIDRCPYMPDRFEPYQPCFQALIHGKPPADVHGFPGWYWHSLPPPPYVETSGYEPSCASKIMSTTVVRDSIWVSARGGIGTYSFNKGSREWSKVGSWELPFRGDAKYVPELDRWLGFSRGRDDQFLCASDLSTVAADGAVPALCRVWKEDIDTNPQNWVLLKSDLVCVDSGRFCIARLFNVYDEYSLDKEIKENFAVITGVELERSDTAEDGIQVVKHKSIRYNIDDKMLELVC